MLVEDVGADVHPVRNDLHRHVVDEVRGDRSGPDIMRTPRRRSLTREFVVRDIAFVGVLVVRTRFADDARAGPPVDDVTNRRPGDTTALRRQQRFTSVLVLNVHSPVANVVVDDVNQVRVPRSDEVIGNNHLAEVYS